MYGGGGNTGAPYRRDFIELYNTTAAPISLAGWSVQYKSATGTTWATTALSGSIPAQRVLPGRRGVRRGRRQRAADPQRDRHPQPECHRRCGRAVNAAAALTCNLAACATTGAVVDLVGFGTANTFAGTTAAPAGSNTSSLSRTVGHQNTANNGADFAAEAPRPGLASTRPDIVTPVDQDHRRDPGAG